MTLTMVALMATTWHRSTTWKEQDVNTESVSLCLYSFIVLDDIYNSIVLHFSYLYILTVLILYLV